MVEPVPVPFSRLHQALSVYLPKVQIGGAGEKRLLEKVLPAAVFFIFAQKPQSADRIQALSREARKSLPRHVAHQPVPFSQPQKVSNGFLHQLLSALAQQKEHLRGLNRQIPNPLARSRSGQSIKLSRMQHTRVRADFSTKRWVMGQEQ